MPVMIHNKEYHTVAERIHLLNGLLGKQEKEYSLNTELISWENGVVIMKATLTIITGESVLTYTGHAYEVEGSSQINKTSALENAETSAIGRALSAAGYGGGDEYASANEVENAIHKQKFNPMTREQAKIVIDLSEHEAIEGDAAKGFDVWLKSKELHSFEEGEKAIKRLQTIIDEYDGLEK